jgi:hypothetical protein
LFAARTTFRLALCGRFALHGILSWRARIEKAPGKAWGLMPREGFEPSRI